MIKCWSQTSATFRTVCADGQTDRHTHTRTQTHINTHKHSTNTHKHTHTHYLSLFLPLSLIQRTVISSPRRVQIIFVVGPIRLGVLPILFYTSVPLYAGFEPAHVCRLKTAGAPHDICCHVLFISVWPILPVLHMVTQIAVR
jgi:hypothetical protein